MGTIGYYMGDMWMGTTWGHMRGVWASLGLNEVIRGRYVHTYMGTTHRGSLGLLNKVIRSEAGRKGKLI